MTIQQTASIPDLSEAAPRAVEASRNAAPSHARGLVGAVLWLFFGIAARAPWLLALLRPLSVWAAVWWSKGLVRDLGCNARRILGGELSLKEQRAFARGVMGSFYDFVADLGRAGRGTPADLAIRVDRIEGEPEYLVARRAGRGAVLVTAHMGSFEVGLAALRGVEKQVHVVFKRDEFAAFERIRSRCRAMLGVHEAPIDEGFPSLVRLRDALRADEVVVMQGDRAMPGQRSQLVPFLCGHLRLPVGPVKLARLTGSPLVPVLVIRGPGGRFTVHLAPPIHVEPGDIEVNGIDPALLAFARALEPYIRRHPEQWLMLSRAFAEDVEGGDGGK